MEYTADYFKFISDHRNDDPSKLRLKLHGDSREWIPVAINNIAALKKARKFRTADNTDFTPKVIPTELSLQQATSANIAGLHSRLAGNAKIVLDMTMGLGMDAMMMSQDPERKILCFDMREELVDAAKVNFADRPNVKVELGNSVKYLEARDNTAERFDLIFIDPARRGDNGERVYNMHDCSPDLIEILPLLRRNGRKLMAKLSPMLDVSQTIIDLPGISALHITEENGECKELLALVDLEKNISESETDTTADIPVTIDRFAGNDRFQTFTFTRKEEAETSPDYLLRIPKKGEYLLEPSPATMKGAPFNLLSRRFNIKALHPNTHLYVAEQPVEDFPGNCYEIEEACQFSSSNIRRLSRSISNAEIAVRNFKGFTADTLRKKMNIRQGGDKRLYAATMQTSGGGSDQILILCKPVI